MAVTRIILWLGNTLVICAVLMALTSVSALVLLETYEATIFGTLALVTGLVGSIFIITTQNTDAREGNGEALIFLLSFWLVMPCIAALPYIFSGVTPNLATAWFEAVSAFTTTGASTLVTDNLSSSMIIWRSALQWFGGVVVATFAVVILAALNLSGTGVHRSMLFTLKTGELFGRLIAIGRIIMGIYALFSMICFIGLIVTGVPAFDALCLSLTSISTGGLTPRSGVLASYVGPVSAVILAITCFLGAANIAILWDFLRLRSWSQIVTFIQNVEHRGLLFIAGSMVMVGLIFVGFGHIFTLVVEAIFFASSAGFDYHVIGIDMLPPAILIAIALIGGSALSTAGGIKIIRLLLLFRHLGTDLNRLSHPSRVVPVIFRGQALPDRAFLSIWMYFFGYTCLFSIGTIALGYSGLGYETAVATSAASISNMGPLLDATLPIKTYADFTDFQMLISGILMLIGRVEVLAVFAILSPSLWRH